MKLTLSVILEFIVIVFICVLLAQQDDQMTKLRVAVAMHVAGVRKSGGVKA